MTVNLVVQQLDRSFAALADPTRRAIVERLTAGPATASELAAPFAMSLTAVLKHVRVLEGAGLVATERTGRTRQCRLQVEALDAQRDWIDRQRALWSARLDALGRVLEEDA